MLQKIFIFSFICIGFMNMIPITFAQAPVDWKTAPIKDAAGKSVCVQDGVATIRGLECIVYNILQIAISGIGLAGFVMFIIGSFQYLLSGGQPKGTEGGRNTMTFAVVGLVVALSSWIIINFIATFTGIDAFLNFKLFVK